jgi:pimeloyl-ACP methyl ester carboxylesterase
MFLTAANAQSKTYILVHGGWHGAWAWKKVVPLLEAKGNKVLAIDLPGHGADKTPIATVTFQDYVDKVVSISKSQPGPVILAGHSMSGLIISQAAEVLGKEKVTKLVYVDAFMPKPEPSVEGSMIFSEDKKICKLKPENVTALFYHDCAPEDIAFAKSQLGWQPLAALATPVSVTDARYGAVPKVFILCTEARDMNKSSISKNVPCEKVYTLVSGHSPFFSMPDKLAAIFHEL